MSEREHIVEVAGQRVQYRAGQAVAVEQQCRVCGQLYWAAIREAFIGRQCVPHHCTQERARLGGAAMINKYG